MNRALFSSDKSCWETPQAFFDRLNDEFHFDCDVAASAENAKCERFYTEADNALEQPWRGVCWCNPPYGRKVGDWVAKAAQSAREGATVVMLLPARTDTRWFHRYIYHRAEIRFVAGRLHFGGSKSGAPFPSMVVIFQSHDCKEDYFYPFDMKMKEAAHD
jgi:phage N-6-adenine-methyltransferase